MVVDEVIYLWVILVAGEEAGPEGFIRAVQCLAELFYSDNGLLASPQPAHLQAVLNVLMGMFDRFGIYTNVNNTVGMVCYPCHMDGGHSEAAY